MTQKLDINLELTLDILLALKASDLCKVAFAAHFSINSRFVAVGVRLYSSIVLISSSTQLPSMNKVNILMMVSLTILLGEFIYLFYFPISFSPLHSLTVLYPVQPISSEVVFSNISMSVNLSKVEQTGGPRQVALTPQSF